MKAQELRIGNYFLDEQGIARKIICIDPDEEWVDNWLYQNCWENGWGMNEPTTQQLVQLCNDFKEYKNWQ